MPIGPEVRSAGGERHEELTRPGVGDAELHLDRSGPLSRLAQAGSDPLERGAGGGPLARRPGTGEQRLDLAQTGAQLVLG